MAHRLPQWILAAGLALTGILASCLGSAGRTVLAPPPGVGGFPTRADDEAVWLEARFEDDQDGVFGHDLHRHGLLAVAVRIGLRPGHEASGLYLDPDLVLPELFLQDGTPLTWEPAPRPPRGGASLWNALDRRRLEFSLLVPFQEAREGYLYFRFDPDRVRVREARVLSRVPGAERELELNASLLRLNVAGAGATRSLSVGIGR